MQDKNPNKDQKKCGESCGCDEAKKNIPAEKTSQNSEKKNELDPTHFGDWQVNGRAIDF